ncbi:MAG TPA: serine/threonine-protein kinase [Candidatus Acidoferrum sp.]
MQVGRYQVLETLGTGATSRVVRGHDPLIDRAVAIKLFSPELARGEARNRFFREARVVGKLAHPFIITLHDMGIEESTLTPYLVMELVEGQSLEKLLSKGSIPVAGACAWAGQVALGLEVAHRRGVIHGDVKPANVLITQEGRPKLTDFGMARLASHEKCDTPLLGTPAYWSPEQIFGRAQDARSDIFSLGVVLYEMITGISPFAGDSINAVCNNILSSTPRPVSHLNSSIPTPLSDLLAACLVKDPENRIASAETLAQQLFPFARQKPVAHTASVPAPTLRNRATRLLRSA